MNGEVNGSSTPKSLSLSRKLVDTIDRTTKRKVYIFISFIFFHFILFSACLGIRYDSFQKHFSHLRILNYKGLDIGEGMFCFTLNKCLLFSMKSISQLGFLVRINYIYLKTVDQEVMIC